MKARLLLLLGALWLGSSPAAAAVPTIGNWDLHEQRVAAHAGLLPALADGLLHGEQPLTAGQLQAALGHLAGLTGVSPTSVPDSPPTVFAFDRLLVDQLGLGAVADAVEATATQAGLQPRPSFGSEVVARLAGLRHDQPYGLDQFELYPTQPITRAEAAFSLARISTWDGGQQAWIRSTLAGLTLPSYTPRQLRVLRIAVAKVGMPYVYGGQTDAPSSLQVHGGYDCSGFVWRVFKLSGNPAGRRIVGRTAAQQAGEVPASTRLPLAAVRGGDLLFFGPGRFGQKATERRITHEGIALSPAWMLNSANSYGGVSLAPLAVPDDRKRHFSWARRVL